MTSTPGGATELLKRIDAIAHLVCDPECEGRCKECPAEVLRDVRAFIASPDSKLEAYRKALEAVEFSEQGKCPLCAGWMMSAYGETPGKHTADCLVGKALAAGG